MSWSVSPRRMTPRQSTASTSSRSASARATTGTSKDPGTQIVRMSATEAPLAASSRLAEASIGSVRSEWNRDTTAPMRAPGRCRRGRSRFLVSRAMSTFEATSAPGTPTKGRTVYRLALRDPGDRESRAMHTPTEALAEILARIEAAPTLETAPLVRAAGRVLARDVASDVDVPPFEKSAMDGFAVRSADFDGRSGPIRLRRVGEARAGAPYRGSVGR